MKPINFYGHPRGPAWLRHLVMHMTRDGRAVTMDDISAGGRAFPRMHKSEPLDGDLYCAVSDLVRRGVLSGPDPLDPCITGDHSDWTYQRNCDGN